MNPSNPNSPNPQLPPVPPQPPGHGGYIPSAAQDAPNTPYNVPGNLAANGALHYQQLPTDASRSPQQVLANPVVTEAKPAPIQPPRVNPNSTQNTLQIAEIRDGIVIMNDGTFRAVVMAKSINFDLMSPQEQEAVEYSYQGFLNSLYFPIQIFLRSQKIDLQPYLERLDKIRTEHDNMLLAMLMEDYINYIAELSQQTNIMDKKFYVVIPYFPTVDVQKALTQSKNFLSGLKSLFNPKEQKVTINEIDLQKAKEELRNRVQSVLSGLLQCGVQGLPLDTQELIELYYDTYNPDTATRQRLRNFNDLTPDVVTKGDGMASQPHLQRELQ